jgi:hypothetical protein
MMCMGWPVLFIIARSLVMGRTIIGSLFCLLVTGVLALSASGGSPEQESVSQESVSLGQLVVQAYANKPWNAHHAAQVSASGEDEAEVLQRQAASDRNEARLAKLRKPLSDIRVDAPGSEVQRPYNLAVELLDHPPELVIFGSGLSIMVPDRYTVSSAHRPLYFEELNLERCGNTYGCATNVVSAFHFLTNTVALPYRLSTERADCLVSSHGDCRTCQSYSHDIEPFGIQPRGALIEAAAIAGFIFLAM